MPQPTPYSPSVDFSNEEANNVGGRSTVRTAPLDAELSAIAATLQGVLANLALNQRDDGEIRDQRVKLHTLSQDVQALLTAGNVTAENVRGAWVTAAVYVKLDLVSQDGNTYICAVAHTAGTFATDLAAGRWLLVALGAATAASAVPFTATATIGATNVQAAIEEADTENRALSAATVAAHAADIASTASGKGAELIGYKLNAIGAAARNVAGVLRESVSVKDFGAACNSTDGSDGTDDTAAVQAAITYCIVNNRDLEVPGLCRLTTTVDIDRAFLAMASPQYFTIYSRNGGGFACSTAITMFSSSFAYAADPVSHLIRFDAIRFKGAGNYNTTAAYVMSSALFRVIFDSCSFDSMKCLNAPSKYTQSHHFYYCNVRGFNGTFYLSGNATYDLKVIGGIYEDSFGNLWDLNVPSGVAFMGACMEGMKTNLTQLGTVLRYSNANGLAVHGCYIEGNEDYDIEWVTGASYGVSVQGNIFSHSLRAQTDITSGRWYQIQTAGTTNWTSIGASSSAVGTVFQYNGAAITGSGGVAYEFSIKWGTCDGCVSSGNFHTQAMHELASDSNVQIADFSQAATVNMAAPFRMHGSGEFQRSTFASRRTDGGYLWTFAEGATGVAAKRFGITCDSASGTPWLDIGGDYGNFGFGAPNLDAANTGTTLFMRKAGATAPTTNAAGGYLYVAPSGALNYKSPGGTVTQLAPN